MLSRLIAVAPSAAAAVASRAAANAAASDDDGADDDETGDARDDDNEVRFAALALVVALEMGASHWAAAIRAVEQCHAALQAPESDPAAHAQLPLDLVVNYGICQLRRDATKVATASADEIARALPCFRVVMEQDAREPLIAQLLAALGDAFEGVDEHYRALVVLKRLLSATAPGDACRALHVRIAWCVRAVANTRAPTFVVPADMYRTARACVPPGSTHCALRGRRDRRTGRVVRPPRQRPRCLGQRHRRRRRIFWQPPSTTAQRSMRRATLSRHDMREHSGRAAWAHAHRSTAHLQPERQGRALESDDLATLEARLIPSLEVAEPQGDDAAAPWEMLQLWFAWASLNLRAGEAAVVTVMP